MPKIKWIEINGFRSFGDGPQRLEFASPVAVAWGPNSQGKTSIAEAFEFQLAQPAQTLGSHAAWASARRVPKSVARQTNFVEIGPVTAFSRTAAQALLPPPPPNW